MTNWPILSVITFLPLVGVILIYFARGDDEAARRNARWIALWTTLITFAVSLELIIGFDPALLTFCIIASWKSVTMRVREYMMAFLVLETLMVGTFCALDLVLFYLFFEGGLIPMFL